jgi:uncharacterized cupin superfamily protein
MNASFELLSRLLMLPAAGLPHPSRMVIDDAVFEPAPISPAHILGGNPVAEVATLLRSADDCFSASVWRSTPGKFRFFYGSDEIIHVLEGEAHVQGDQGGPAIELRPGDVAMFPIDTSAVWHITKTLKKVALFRSHPGDPLGRLRAKLTKRR